MAPPYVLDDKAVKPAVARALAKWHAMIESEDMTDLPSILHPDAVFRSPAAHIPYASRDAVVLALSTVITVFQDFTYYRQLASPDGLNVVLEFSAVVQGKGLKGIDLIRFNDDGQIVDFEVMVRPLNGLQALYEEMKKRLSNKIPAYKDKAKL